MTRKQAAELSAWQDRLLGELAAFSEIASRQLVAAGRDKGRVSYLQGKKDACEQLRRTVLDLDKLPTYRAR